MLIDKLIADIEASSFIETNYDNRLISTARLLEILKSHESAKAAEQPKEYDEYVPTHAELSNQPDERSGLVGLSAKITRAIAMTQRAPHDLNSDCGKRMTDDAYVEYLGPYLQKTVAAVIAVLPVRESVGWISVKDDLPRHYVDVLVFRGKSYAARPMVSRITDKSVYEDTGEYFNGKMQKERTGYKMEWDIDGVTHWMPLPATNQIEGESK